MVRLECVGMTKCASEGSLHALRLTEFNENCDGGRKKELPEDAEAVCALPAHSCQHHLPESSTTAEALFRTARLID